MSKIFKFSKFFQPRGRQGRARGLVGLSTKDGSGKGDKYEMAGLTFTPDADRRSAVRPGKRNRFVSLLALSSTDRSELGTVDVGHSRLGSVRLVYSRQDAVGTLFCSLS